MFTGKITATIIIKTLTGDNFFFFADGCSRLYHRTLRCADNHIETFQYSNASHRDRTALKCSLIDTLNTFYSRTDVVSGRSHAD